MTTQQEQNLIHLLQNQFQRNPENFLKELKNYDFLLKFMKQYKFSQKYCSIELVQFLKSKGFDFFTFYNDKIVFLYYQNLPDHTLAYLLDNYVKENNGLNNLEPYKIQFLKNAISTGKKMYATQLLKYGVNPFEKDEINQLNAFHNILSFEKENFPYYQSVINQYHHFTEKEKQEYFENILQFLTELATHIKTKDHPYIDTFLSVIKQHIPMCDEFQKEKLIATTVFSPYFKLLSLTLEALNINNKNYNPQLFPLWKNLKNAKNENFFYYFLNKQKITFDVVSKDFNPLLSFHHIKNQEESFFYQFLSFCEKNNFFNSATKKIFKNLIIRHVKMENVVKEKINDEFLLSPNIHDGNQNWFSTLSQSLSYSNYPSCFLLSINQALKTIHETWLHKNNLNKLNIEIFYEHSINSIHKIPSFLTTHFIEDDIKNNYLSSQQKADLLKCNIDCFCNGSIVQVENIIFSLIHNISLDEKFNQEYLKFNEKTLSILKYKNLNIFNQLNTILLYKKILQNINDNENSQKSKRHKI